MKSDTEYFTMAVEAWRKKYRFASQTPLSMDALSQVLRDAQALKDADRKRIEEEGQPAA
jgi:hypothetical protein